MSREFLANDGLDATALEARLVEALSSVHAMHRSTERRVWWDTHDWRLFRSGLLLEQCITGQHAWLVLTYVGGGMVSRVPVGRRAITMQTLPDGAVRRRIETLVGIRALLPRAAAQGATTLLAVLDDQAKTVARVGVQGPLTVDEGIDIPGVRVRVESMRGYDKDARLVAERLQDTPGITAAASSLFEDVADACGLQPGRYRAKPDLVFDPDMPATQAFSEALGQLLEIVRDNVDGTIRQMDTEFLHDLRVAVRRSRSVLKAARRVIDEGIRQRYAHELKWLADATSQCRDLDVYLLQFGEIISDSDSEEIDPFYRLLQRRHRKAHAALNRVLRSRRFIELLDGWERDLAQSSVVSDMPQKPTSDVARALLRRAWTRCR